MKIRHATHSDDISLFATPALRERFVVSELFRRGELHFVYSHHDRLVLGGVIVEPGTSIPLPTYAPLRSDYFCQRRELAVVAVGDGGVVSVDGTRYSLENKDVVYIGRGSREIIFSAEQGHRDAAFYLASALAHVTFPTTHIPFAAAAVSVAGSRETANLRKVHKYIHEDGVHSAQLVLGITALEPGNVWNSMPCHLHDRRTEVYLYMDLPVEHRVQHQMGRPDDTRSLMMSNREAVISPSWSVHFGAGTSNYSFVWAMAGENQGFADMDQISVADLE